MNKIIVNMWGGYSSERRQCVRAVSDDRIEERRSEVRLNREGVATNGYFLD